MRRMMRNRTLIEAYLTARETIVERGFGAEIDWQETRCLRTLKEADFLREAAWVILSSGMRESVVRHLFGRISEAFLDWVSADMIVINRLWCEAKAIRVFNHPRKIIAIGSVCERVARTGFDEIYNAIRSEGVEFLRTLDFVGPVTSFHLAKNIGLDVAKPDRHLVRIARAARVGRPGELCQVISNATGDRVSVVDLVLWRYSTLNPRDIRIFQRQD